MYPLYLNLMCSENKGPDKEFYVYNTYNKYRVKSYDHILSKLILINMYT